MKYLFLSIFLITTLWSGAETNQVQKIDAAKLKAIEEFLSTMTTLEANMTMDIISGKNIVDHFDGKIWLDRKKSLLRINYGNNHMIASKGTLRIVQENETPQEFSTEDTPAGILLKPKINFESEGITVKSLIVIKDNSKDDNDLWQLHLCYDSPAGSVPITLYFKSKPVMLLLGWSIHNPNQTMTNVHLDPEKTHMAIDIDTKVFETK